MTWSSHPAPTPMALSGHPSFRYALRRSNRRPMRQRPPRAVVDCMDDLPVARGAWLQLDAAAELLRLDAARIRRWIANGSVEVRVVDGLDFVPLHQLRDAEREGI